MSVTTPMLCRFVISNNVTNVLLPRLSLNLYLSGDEFLELKPLVKASTRTWQFQPWPGDLHVSSTLLFSSTGGIIGTGRLTLGYCTQLLDVSKTKCPVSRPPCEYRAYSGYPVVLRRTQIPFSEDPLSTREQLRYNTHQSGYRREFQKIQSHIAELCQIS